MPGNNPVFRVYEHQCGPCTYSILPPEVHVPVIDDGMLDAVTQHGIADALRKLLLVSFLMTGKAFRARVYPEERAKTMLLATMHGGHADTAKQILPCQTSSA